MKKKKINFNLYFHEFVFAFLVILVHVTFPSGNTVLDSIGRTTVFFFFIFSSYFYTRSLNKENYKYTDSIKRSLRLFIIAGITFVVYFLLSLPLNIYLKGAPLLFSEFNMSNLVTFFVDFTPRTTFLWFMISLAICYLIFPLIYKFKLLFKGKFAFLVPVFILIAVYILRIISAVVFKKYLGFELQDEITRNSLFTGLPCFLLGGFIHDHYSRIKKVNSFPFVLMFVLLLGTSTLEAYIHKNINGSSHEFYLSSIVLAVLSVIFCLQNNHSFIGEKLHYLFGKSGPMFVYLSHVFFIDFFDSIFDFEFKAFALVGLSLVISLFIGYLFNLLVRLIKFRFSLKS